jgi:hypothetical protein
VDTCLYPYTGLIRVAFLPAELASVLAVFRRFLAVLVDHLDAFAGVEAEGIDVGV